MFQKRKSGSQNMLLLIVEGDDWYGGGKRLPTPLWGINLQPRVNWAEALIYSDESHFKGEYFLIIKLGFSTTEGNSHFAGAETTVDDGMENQNFSSSQLKQKSGPKYSIESGLCLAGMLLFWVCWSSFYTPTPGRGHAKSKSGYFSTRRYRNPPSPLPNFLNPLNWGGHLIGTGMWQLCQPCSNVNNQRHLHTLSSTPQLFWGERHLAHHLLFPPLSCFPLQ